MKQQTSSILILRNTVCFIIIVFALDFLCGELLEYYYFKQDSGYLSRTTYCLEKSQEDIIVFGSSRAHHHYDTRVINHRFNLPVLNAGSNGQFIPYNYAVLKSVLKRVKPKIIILDFSAREFELNPQHYQRLSSLLPYYSRHPEIQTIIQKRGPFERLKLLSRTYPFNSLGLSILIGNSELNKSRMGDYDINGFVPLKSEMNPSTARKNPAIENPIDDYRVEVYKSFLDDCNKAGVKLYVVTSPYFSPNHSLDTSLKLAKDIAKDYNVDFIDFSHDPDFLGHHKLFSDPIHLNEQGARLFSSKLAEVISPQ